MPDVPNGWFFIILAIVLIVIFLVSWFFEEGERFFVYWNIFCLLAAIALPLVTGDVWLAIALPISFLLVEGLLLGLMSWFSAPWDPSKCQPCNGRGRVISSLFSEQQCESCGGSGVTHTI